MPWIFASPAFAVPIAAMLALVFASAAFCEPYTLALVLRTPPRREPRPEEQPVAIYLFPYLGSGLNRAIVKPKHWRPGSAAEFTVRKMQVVVRKAVQVKVKRQRIVFQRLYLMLPVPFDIEHVPRRQRTAPAGRTLNPINDYRAHQHNDVVLVLVSVLVHYQTVATFGEGIVMTEQIALLARQMVWNLNATHTNRPSHAASARDESYRCCATVGGHPAAGSSGLGLPADAVATARPGCRAGRRHLVEARTAVDQQEHAVARCRCCLTYSSSAVAAVAAEPRLSAAGAARRWSSWGRTCCRCCPRRWTGRTAVDSDNR